MRGTAHERHLVAAAVAFVMLTVGCSAPPEGDASPAGIVFAIGGVSRIDPADRLGDDSRVVLSGFEGELRDLGPEGWSVGNPTVAWTGQRAFVAARAPDGEQTALYSVSLPDGVAERLPLGGLEGGSADELPDGRIVLSARTEDRAPTPELRSGWALFVFDPEAETIQRITWGLSELDPAVLGDGRIVYSGWQPGGDGRGDEGALALFTVHPDGSGVAPFHGHHGGSRWRIRPRELAGGDIAVLAGDDAEGLRPWRIDRRSPGELASAAVGPGDRALRAVARLGTETDLGLDGEGRVIELPDGTPLDRPRPEPSARDFAVVAPRPRPQGHLSMVDPSGDRGRIFGVDLRPAGTQQARAALLRVRGQRPGESERVLGRVDLSEDGSAFLEVPANVRLWLDVLDSAGQPLAVSRTPIWVRPNEKRGCVGCHEPAGTSPPNRRPAAVVEEPVDLTGAMG